jgi:glyoxylase-like metal-dependent hydrolase (beta-lactamase superfamily II)
VAGIARTARSTEAVNAVQVLRLNLGTLHVVAEPWPVHGFVVLHQQLGAVLIDTGCGGPQRMLRDYRVANRAVADALADHGLHPADVRLVITTHLHFDHCGQIAVFPHARLLVQRRELVRVRREGGEMLQWLESTGARLELIEGDVALADGLRIVATPGHTVGHQSVVVETDESSALFVGDAAFRRTVWMEPDGAVLAPGQADDVAAWRRSLDQLHALEASDVYFCHDD